jgi:hypothetical protein
MAVNIGARGSAYRSPRQASNPIPSISSAGIMSVSSTGPLVTTGNQRTQTPHNQPDHPRSITSNGPVARSAGKQLEAGQPPDPCERCAPRGRTSRLSGRSRVVTWQISVALTKP